MENMSLTRSYLETLPSADLLSIADELGIDIPENLNRRFIIGELLEMAEDLNRETVLEPMNEETDDIKPLSVLPKTYNETQISIVLRNPVWAFVYWDINETELEELELSLDFVSLNLRISMFKKDDSPKGIELLDFFDITVNRTCREQYVLLPIGGQLVKVDLIAEFANSSQRILASSRKLNIPIMDKRLAEPFVDTRFSPILKLSGLQNLLKTHYANHRQSFI